MKTNDYFCLAIVIIVMFFLSLALSNTAAAARPGTIVEQHQPQMANPNAFKIEEGVNDYINEKVDLFIDSVTWCFTNACNNQANVDLIGNILESYGWTEEQYGVACIPRKDESGVYLELRIVIVSKVNPDHKYLHQWFLSKDLTPDLALPNIEGGI